MRTKAFIRWPLPLKITGKPVNKRRSQQNVERITPQSQCAKLHFARLCNACSLEITFYCLRSHSSFSTSRCTRVCSSNAWNMASVLFSIGVTTNPDGGLGANSGDANNHVKPCIGEIKTPSRRKERLLISGTKAEVEFQSAKPKSGWHVFHSWNKRVCSKAQSTPTQRRMFKTRPHRRLQPQHSRCGLEI